MSWSIGIVREKEFSEFVKIRDKESIGKCLTVIAKTNNGKFIIAYRKGLKCVKILNGLKISPVGEGFILADDDRFDFTPLKRKLERLGKEKFLWKSIFVKVHTGNVYDLRDYTLKYLCSKHNRRKRGSSR